MTAGGSAIADATLAAAFIACSVSSAITETHAAIATAATAITTGATARCRTAATASTAAGAAATLTWMPAGRCSLTDTTLPAAFIAGAVSTAFA
jgi:hypothetical protein